MSFAAEINDFLKAYQTVSGVLSDQEKNRLAGEELDFRREDAASLRAWRQAQIDKTYWDMGAQGREDDSIVNFGTSGDPLDAMRTISKSGGGGSTQAAFVETMRPYAEKVAQQTGLDPNLILAQSALETGWGKSAPDNNYFGIKGGGNARATKEFVDGQMVATDASFRGYGSPEESFNDYAEFISDDRYANVRAAGSIEEQARALQAAGYATDPEYANKLTSIASRIEGLVGSGGDDTFAAVQDTDADYGVGTIPPVQDTDADYGTGVRYNDLSRMAKIGGGDASQGVGAPMQAPKGLVIHHTGGGGTAEDVMGVLNDRGYSVQYIIDREGNISMGLPEGAGAQHIKTAQNNSGLDNSNAFGVEVIAADDEDILPVQIEAAKRLAADLGKRYGFDANNVWGHGEINSHKQSTEGLTIANAIRGGAPIADSTLAGELRPTGQEEIVNLDASAEEMEAAAAVPAIPEEGGYDPLPQTSGHTDAVAGSDHDAVQFAMNDRGTPRTTILKEVLSWGADKLGVGTRPAVDDGEETPAEAAMADGLGAAPADLIERLEGVVEEKFGPVSQDRKTLEVMSIIWNYWNRKGEPEKAKGATFAIYQTYKVMAQQTLALAQVAGEEGDFQDAVQKFADAYSLVPDGKTMTAEIGEDGQVVMTITDEDTGQSTEQRLDPEELVSQIMHITPDQFDELVVEKIMGPPGAAEPEPLTDIPELTAVPGGGVPETGDGAIPETPAALPLPTDEEGKDDALTSLPSEVPAGTEDAPGVEPEDTTLDPGDTLVYPDGRRVSVGSAAGAGSIDVAGALKAGAKIVSGDEAVPEEELAPTGSVQSGDKIVTKGGPTWNVVSITNADSGASTFVLQQEGDESTVIPYNEEWLQKILSTGGQIVKAGEEGAVPEEAIPTGAEEGGEGDATGVPAEPVEEIPYAAPKANEPSIPITQDQFDDLAAQKKWTAAQYDQYHQIWAAKVKARADWEALQPTAASIAEKRAVDMFFKQLQETGPTEVFRPDFASFPAVSNEMLTQFRLYTEEHNKRQAEQVESMEGEVSTNALVEVADRLPKGTEFHEPVTLPQIPGVIGDEDYGPLYGQEPEAVPTRIYGATPTRGPEVGNLTGAEIRDLSTADRTTASGMITNAREDVAKWDTRLAARPAVPATEEEVTNLNEAYTALVGVDNETETVPGRIDNNPDKKVVQFAKFMRDEVANSGLQDEVLMAAREVKTIPENTMDDNKAVESAWDFISFDPYNPTKTLFVAKRADPSLGFPADTLAVYRNNKPIKDQVPVYIPKNTFANLDSIRRGLAEKYVAANPSATVGGKPFDLSTVTGATKRPPPAASTPAAPVDPAAPTKTPGGRVLTGPQEAYRRRREELGIPLDPDDIRPDVEFDPAAAGWGNR